MTTEDLMRRLDAPQAEAWRAEHTGDLVVGRITHLSSYDAGYGLYPIVTVEPVRVIVAGREVKPLPPLLAVHGLGTVLAARLADVQVGGELAVRFDGEKLGRNERTYKAWSTSYDPPAPGSALVARLAPAPLDDDEEPF